MDKPQAVSFVIVYWVTMLIIGMTLGSMLGFALAGCATVITETGADENGRPFLRQEVSGTAKAVIKAANQNIDADMRIDPETGIVYVDIVSGQKAEGVQGDGLEMITNVFGKVIAELARQNVAAPVP